MSDSEIRILLIEDNYGDALLMDEYLQECSFAYTLRVAERLSAALDILRQETFDLLLMDMNLPDGAGIQIVSAVEGVAPGLPIIVLSGSVSRGVELMATEIGIRAVLRKGVFTPEELCTAITAAATNRLSFS